MGEGDLRVLRNGDIERILSVAGRAERTGVREPRWWRRELHLPSPDEKVPTLVVARGRFQGAHGVCVRRVCERDGFAVGDRSGPATNLRRAPDHQRRGIGRGARECMQVCMLRSVNLRSVNAYAVWVG